jgi:hypothetical protein
VLYLEMQLFSDDRLVYSCVCGFLLLLLNLRARFSDVTCITGYVKDLATDWEDNLSGYIECTTSRTKTGKSKEKEEDVASSLWPWGQSERQRLV